ncbi:hypothetical protein GCM10022236_27470 [Microlunatus ginsengisoli]|uniref:LuxR family transcriptional regulator, maltose regulon positive regulatory protein n=2 Tax=Microlunatus ginsengisoli TaxID=363863 RepID=A0ABP7A2F1_9ACTN
MRLVLGDHNLALGAGEAAEFDTRVPHWLGSTVDEPAEILSMFGPPGERVHARARPPTRTLPGNEQGMTDVLLGTKLYVPKLRRRSVARPRLIRRMEAGADARLTLISAPAGFGKTTVPVAWLHEAATADRSVAWLSLDAADNEPASFWTYVATALEGAVAGVGSRALEVLAASPAPTELVLTTLLNELAAAPGEVWLVLDDYHLVDNQEVTRVWPSSSIIFRPTCTS